MADEPRMANGPVTGASASARSRHRRRGRRGFALFAVIILMALMTAAVALALDDAVVAVRNAGGVRASEMIKSGLDRGIAVAMFQLQTMDPSALLDLPDQYDIFAGATPSTGASELPDALGTPMSFPYPDSGPYENQYTVRIGIRPGQRTRAPTGENVNKSFGQIFEIQVGVAATGVGIPPAEQRVSVGVLLPRRISHAN